MVDGFVPRLLMMGVEGCVCVCTVSRVAKQVIVYAALMTGQIAAYWRHG